MRGSPSSPTTKEERERERGHLSLNLIKHYSYTNTLILNCLHNWVCLKGCRDSPFVQACLTAECEIWWHWDHRWAFFILSSCCMCYSVYVLDNNPLGDKWKCFVFTIWWGLALSKTLVLNIYTKAGSTESWKMWDFVFIYWLKTGAMKNKGDWGIFY